jgi:hypothetical protein
MPTTQTTTMPGCPTTATATTATETTAAPTMGTTAHLGEGSR